MSIRVRVAAGLLLAVMASGAAVSTASAADTSPASGTTTAGALPRSGHHEGPFSTAAECSDRAWAWAWAWADRTSTALSPPFFLISGIQGCG